MDRFITSTEYGSRPVGVFDSGFGGASTLRSILRELPDERFIYYGDNKNAPYGDREESDILRLSEAAAEYLLEKGVKALVVACNTATSASIKALRQKLAVPVVSVEPAIKPACEAEGCGKVLMLATVATTKLARYRALQQRMPDPSRVINVGCSGLVERIEQGITADNAFDDILIRHLGAYEGLTVDGIVLGCTHFPFISGAIARYASMHFKGEHRLYDGNAGTARQLGRVLRREGLAAPKGAAEGLDTNSRVTFCTSADKPSAEPIFRMLLSLPEWGK